MTRVGMHEAKTRLSQLVEHALAGEEVVITRRGRAAVRLEPVREGEGFAALAGVWTGEVHLADDFDELPEGLADALGAR